MHNSVFIVGTGTIGEPLIGLLSLNGKELGIDEVLFYKHTPRRTDLPLIAGLIRKGATLVTNQNHFKSFRDMGVDPTYTFEEALDTSKVVVDCSPSNKGLQNKEVFYEKRSKNGQKTKFMAQGSEFGFGKMYASGINDNILYNNQFIQVASCNTHNISVILKNLAFDPEARNEQTLGISYLKEASFMAIRRASDISQTGEFISSPQVGVYKDPTFGTHHARDAFELYKTLGYTEEDLYLFSSAIKLNTQFMHVLHFDIRLSIQLSKAEVLERFINDPYVAITYKMQASEVFSYGREHGHFGRILDQSVVVVPTIHVQEEKRTSKGSRILGFCFTPQDGNSLLSSATAVTHYLNEDPEEAWNRLRSLDRYRFDEV